MNPFNHYGPMRFIGRTGERTGRHGPRLSISTGTQDREKARRLRQIAKGSLRAENGLVTTKGS